MNKNIKLSVVCLGCPKNIADLEYLLSEIDGVKIVSEEESKIVIINTCGFLKSARDEVFENINRLKNKKIIIIGCLSSWFSEKERRLYPQIFAVLSSANYKKIQETIYLVEKNKKNFLISKEAKKFEDYNKKTLLFNTPYAYIKIAEGCNHKCGYCLIPSLKGRYRSRKMKSIINEAENLVKKGIKELILVAQDCGNYGIDLYKKKNLAKLLRNLEKINGDFWIRVLYTYPEKIDDELIQTIKNSKKVCPYLDIPLQHGDAKILKAMRRPSNTKKTEDLIKKIRKEIPEISIRTSIIVGYPGEDKESFKKLKDYILRQEIDLLGVFEFSKEPNTYAEKLPNQVDQKTKKFRRETLMELQQSISTKKNKKLINKTQRVLIESFEKNLKLYIGRSQRFAPEIDGIIFVKTKKKLKIGEFINVKIIDSLEYDLIASV